MTQLSSDDLRGCTGVAPGIGLRTLAKVIGHLGAGGQIGIMDGT
ncbi:MULTISPECIES: hypothetical protein [unclassified Streptomyces]|uniref:Uncharacterized protein n=1 Tax=Streptomyces sp. NBC_00180 TaxID=2903632 RepID=A0AAU1IC67_9ACTN|nr:hypothetical protein OG331_47220 [Streptomyces sp. NBC_01017]